MKDTEYYKKYEPIEGSWEIKRVIGQGSFGKVFEIERQELGHTYKAALKVMTIPSEESEIKSVQSELHDEASVTAYFHSLVESMANELAIMDELKGNSNIVSYANHMIIPHGTGIGWDILIRMELLTSLVDHVATQGMSAKDVVQLGIGICKALELCQKKNLIHRDIKPENIFISETGDYKLGDFGIARTAEKTQSNFTGGAGTVAYMAPEVYNKKRYGADVDIYSLGIVLYRLLNNNRLPFFPPAPASISYQDRENARERRMSGEPLSRPANGSDALWAIVQKACAFEPKDRFDTPGEMRTALMEVIEEQSDQLILKPYQVIGQNSSIHKRTSESTTGPTTGPRHIQNAEGTPESIDNQISPPSPKLGDMPMQDDEDSSTMGGKHLVHIRFLVDGKEISKKTYASGQKIQIPQDPKRSNEKGYRYTFSGWSPEVEEHAVVDTDYQAVFRQEETRGRPKRALIAAIFGVALVVVGGMWLASSGRKTHQGTAESPTPGMVVSTPGNGTIAVEESAASIPTELNWSDWATDLPAGVNGSNSAIEAKTQYCSTPLYKVVNGEAPGSDYRLLEARTEYGEWGGWSRAQSTPITANDWTEVATQTGYTGWSGMSAWSGQSVSNTDTRRVETREISYNNHMSTVTEYRYQTRSRITLYQSRTREVTYYYYNNSDWSDYSDEPIYQSDGIYVKIRPQYRYAESAEGRVSRASMDNFPVFQADYTNLFADVDDNKWYGANRSNVIRTVNELGILLPDAHMNFRPEDPVTVGQAVRAAVMLNRIYNGQTGLLGENNGNYHVYADYAAQIGMILENEFSDLTAPATRQIVAYLFYQALPEEELAKRVEVDSVSDVDVHTKDYECVLGLAQAGVVTLREGNTYVPEDFASRAEMASIVDKLIYPDNRTAS